MTKARKSSQPLFTDPLGKLRGVTVGVLRATYKGQANTTSAYAAGKRRLCHRSEVLLPPEAPDLYLDAGALWQSFEGARRPRQQDLAIAATLYLDDIGSLHAGWERARAYARSELCLKRGLPVQLIMHVPSLSASANDPHAHLIIAARRLRSWGWGEFSDLCSDEAQRVIWDSWNR